MAVFKTRRLYNRAQAQESGSLRHARAGSRIAVSCGVRVEAMIVGFRAGKETGEMKDPWIKTAVRVGMGRLKVRTWTALQCD